MSEPYENPSGRAGVAGVWSPLPSVSELSLYNTVQHPVPIKNSSVQPHKQYNRKRIVKQRLINTWETVMRVNQLKLAFRK